MPDENKEYIALIQKQIDGTITKVELVRLDHLSAQIPESEQASLFAQVWQNALEKDNPKTHPFSAEESRHIFQQVIAEDSHTIEPQKNYIRQPKIWKWISTAAALLVIGIGAALLYHKYNVASLPERTLADVNLASPDIEPGRNRAVFLTEDGKAITLDSNRVGLIEKDETFSIVQSETGEIQYTHTQNAPIKQHTVKTPRGGQINFLLPDGTKVWLNAESSISFASNMGAGDRIVKMTGEVYFEVTKSAGRSFVVDGQFGQIEVLGTKFNVNTYDTKETTAALLTGAIRLQTSAGSVHMQPDQLTTIAADGSMHTVHDPNVKNIIQWKDGFFHFDRADVHTIAGQLARWYDIDVKIAGKRQNTAINGTISRNVKLSTMLEMLDYLGLKATYKNNNLTVNVKNP
ncbi:MULTISPECIES: FecR family protein [Sphingobacterium]|uniref:FecR family protein n=1 Tax=Sphingobacterium populi TaxID=1812824 RepID=A0ABW5U861_9SPHI|nr:FecR family protein [Sphingobacterium sp. CFCC 11742]